MKSLNHESMKSLKRFNRFGIFVFVLFFSYFLQVDSASAAQCCIEEIKRGHDTEFRVNSCSIKQTSPCKTTEVKKNCIRSRREGFETCDLIREREIDCLGHIRCRDKFVETIVKCPELDRSQCESGGNQGSCFWVNNACYSLADGNICRDIRDSTTCERSSACGWSDNVCITILESSLSAGYTAEDGSLLPACAISGTCRDVDDLLILVLNYSARVFSLLGVVAFVMFVYGGVTMVTAFGNPEKFKQGQQILVAAIIGVTISLSAYLLVNFLLDSLGVEEVFRF